jgi:hypothetical protein
MVTTCDNDTLDYADTDIPNGKSITYEVGVHLNHPSSMKHNHKVSPPTVSVTPIAQPGAWNITFRPSMRFASPPTSTSNMKVNTVSMNGVVRAIMQTTGLPAGLAVAPSARAALGGEWRVTWIPDIEDHWPSLLVLHRTRSSNALAAVLGSPGSMYTTSADGSLNTTAAYPGQVALSSSKMVPAKLKTIEPGYSVLTVSASSNNASYIRRPKRFDLSRGAPEPQGNATAEPPTIGASSTITNQFQTISYYSKGYLIKHFGSPESIFFTFPIKPIDITVGGTMTNTQDADPDATMLRRGPAAMAAAEAMDVISGK